MDVIKEKWFILYRFMNCMKKKVNYINEISFVILECRID